MTDDLPPRLTTDLFRTASGARLQEIYRTLFHRIAEREDELHVFTDGGFSPRRVLDVLDDLEHHWPDPRVRPPLFGVPVGVKDLYRTAGYAIHAGSLLPASCFRGPEADIVTALKKLGCVVMGITQSSEFAGAAPASTCNPLNPGHTPDPAADRQPVWLPATSPWPSARRQRGPWCAQPPTAASSA